MRRRRSEFTIKRPTSLGVQSPLGFAGDSNARDPPRLRASASAAHGLGSARYGDARSEGGGGSGGDGGGPRGPAEEGLTSAIQRGALERIQLEMAELQERVSAYARQEELERHRVAALDERATETQAAIAAERKFKQERGGADAARIHFQLMSKNVAIYEKKVRAARVRRSELEKANRSTKEEVGLLRRELQRMLAHYLVLKRKFEGAQAEMAARLERSREMREETAAAEEELRRLAAEVEAQREQDAATKAELDAKLRAERSSDDKASRVRREKELQKRVATVVGDLTQGEEEQIKERVLAMERERKRRERAIGEWAAKAEAYKRELEELKTQTGVHDVDELLEDFARNEREVFRLYEYVQRTGAETKETEEEVERLRAEMAAYRADGQAEAARSVGRVRAMEEQAAEIQRQSAELARKAEAEAATLTEVFRAVHSLHDAVGCERFAGALRGVLRAQHQGVAANDGGAEGGGAEGGGAADGHAGDQTAAADSGPLPLDAVTDGTVLQVMGVVEQAAYDLVHRYATEVAGRSHEEALPVPPVPAKLHVTAADASARSAAPPFSSPAMPASLFRAKRRHGGAVAVRKALTGHLAGGSPAPVRRSATAVSTPSPPRPTPLSRTMAGDGSGDEVGGVETPGFGGSGRGIDNAARESQPPADRGSPASRSPHTGASSEPVGFAPHLADADADSASSGSSDVGDGRDGGAVPAKPLSREEFLAQVARQYGPITLPSTAT